MTYLSGKSKSRRRHLTIAVFLILFSMCVYFWPSLKSVAFPVVEPVINLFSRSKENARGMPGFLGTYVTSHTTLAARNSALEILVEQLENQVAQRDSLLREQSFLSGVQAGSTTPSMVLYPIMEDITKIYSTLLLSKGYKDGVQVGGLVYMRGLQPACEIVEIHDETSLCELLSKGGKITEGVTGSSRITISLVGAGGGSFVAEVPKGSLISVGEDVYLRSNQMYVVGTVIAVKEDEQSTGAKIYIKGGYNPVTSSIFYMNARYEP